MATPLIHPRCTFNDPGCPALPLSRSDAAVDWHDEIADSFDAGYRRSAGFIERLSVWQPLIEATLSSGERVLDAGCGSGVFSFVAAAKANHVDALDGSGNMIAIAKREAAARGIDNIAFRQALLSDLSDYPAGGYDLIMSSSVLEYVEGYRSVLDDFARLLKGGGKLLLSMPNADSLYRRAEKLAFSATGRPRYFAHVRNVVTATELTRTLRDAGFRVEGVHYFAEPPLPAWLNGLVRSDRRRKTLFVVEASVAA